MSFHESIRAGQLSPNSMSEIGSRSAGASQTVFVNSSTAAPFPDPWASLVPRNEESGSRMLVESLQLGIIIQSEIVDKITNQPFPSVTVKRIEIPSPCAAEAADDFGL